MNPALLLLIWLKLKGFLRRWLGGLRSVKGVLLSLVGLLVFVPWLFSMFFAMKGAPPGFGVEGARRFGPFFLMGYAVLSLVFTTGERVLYFSPAEVSFLFPAPFRPRELLAYKLMVLTATTLLSGLFFSVAFGAYRTSWLAGFVGVFLALMFFQLMAMAVGLGANVVGVLAHNRRRKWLLGVVGVVLGLVAISVGKGAMALPLPELLTRVEGSPVAQALVMPFRPFVLAFTSRSIWPELWTWGAVSLAIDLALVGIVFGLNASYLEAAANSSAKMYARLQQIRRGGRLGGSNWSAARAGARKSLIGDLPWLGGVGPALWRQMLGALRDPMRLVSALLIVAVPSGMMLYFAATASDNGPIGRSALLGVQAMVVWMTLFLTPMIPFDFRGDLDRMEELKILPIPPWALSIGQVATPTLILSVPQFLVFWGAGIWGGSFDATLVVGSALILPVNFMIIGIENLLFLFFPTRILVTNPGDFAAFGRQIVLVMAKLLGIAITGGLASLAALGVYYLLIPSLPIALVAALIVAIGLAAGLVPFLAFAFTRFDVSTDTPA